MYDTYYTFITVLIQTQTSSSTKQPVTHMSGLNTDFAISDCYLYLPGYIRVLAALVTGVSIERPKSFLNQQNKVYFCHTLRQQKKHRLQIYTEFFCFMTRPNGCV